MIPSVNNVPSIHDTNFTTTDVVIIVTIWMRLAREKENPGHVNLFIPSFYMYTSINSPLPYLKESFKDTKFRCPLSLPSQCSIVLLLVKAWVKPYSYWYLSEIQVSPLESYDPFRQQCSIDTWYQFHHNRCCDNRYHLNEACKGKRKSWACEFIHPYRHRFI